MFKGATILTKNASEHLLVLWETVDWPCGGIIIPTGFASGYSGEGSRGFSLALCMLSEHRVPLYHVKVRETVFDQIDGGYFPDLWQLGISQRALQCEMPIQTGLSLGIGNSHNNEDSGVSRVGGGGILLSNGTSRRTSWTTSIGKSVTN